MMHGSTSIKNSIELGPTRQFSFNFIKYDQQFWEYYTSVQCGVKADGDNIPFMRSLPVYCEKKCVNSFIVLLKHYTTQ